MQITGATFTDPAFRPQLQQYYESKKAAAIESLRSRDAGASPKEISYTDADGKTHTAVAAPVSAEKMIGALASFEQWLDISAKMYGEGGWASRLNKMPTEEQMIGPHPDSRSDVRTAFSHNGELLAYITKDGGVANIRGGDRYTDKAIQSANEKGLLGQARVDYLAREIQAAFLKKYPNLQTDNYKGSTAPTYREFAESWYDNYNIDEDYRSRVASAKEQAESFRVQQKQMQDHLREIETYLLSFQEAA